MAGTGKGADAADASIRDKIEQARSMNRAHGEALRADPRVQGLLDRLARCLDASREIMLRGGVVAACRWCEQEAGGSCCGAGIENRYTPHLLLINLLLGAALPDRRARLDSCYFLGDAGCRLRARHVLCVNYLCERLRRDLAPEVLRELEERGGSELEAVFALHETLKKITGA